MIPESAVRAWWNQLSVEQRRAVSEAVLARLKRHDLNHGWGEWSALWDELGPLGQQSLLRAYYERVVADHSGRGRYR